MGRALFLSLLWVAMLSASRVVQSLPYDYSSSSEGQDGEVKGFQTRA